MTASIYISLHVFYIYRGCVLDKATSLLLMSLLLMSALYIMRRRSATYRNHEKQKRKWRAFGQDGASYELRVFYVVTACCSVRNFDICCGIVHGGSRTRSDLIAPSHIMWHSTNRKYYYEWIELWMLPPCLHVVLWRPPTPTTIQKPDAHIVWMWVRYSLIIECMENPAGSY